MSEHEWTNDSPDAGDLERSMTPGDPGAPAHDPTESAVEDASAGAERKPRFRGMPVNLAALSFSKFHRRPKPDADRPAPAERAEAEADGRGPSGRFARLRELDWSWFPLANARRETRVGVAISLSFVVLVTAMILNRKPGEAKKAPSLALNKPVGETLRKEGAAEAAPDLDASALKKSARKKRLPPDPPAGSPSPPAIDLNEGFRLASNDTPPAPTEPAAPPKNDPPPKVDPSGPINPDPVAPPKLEPTEAPGKGDAAAPPRPDPVPPKTDPAPMPPKVEPPPRSSPLPRPSPIPPPRPGQPSPSPNRRCRPSRACPRRPTISRRWGPTPGARSETGRPPDDARTEAARPRDHARTEAPWCPNRNR